MAEFLSISVSDRSPTGGMKKIISLFVKEAQTPYPRMRTHSWQMP